MGATLEVSCLPGEPRDTLGPAERAGAGFRRAQPGQARRSGRCLLAQACHWGMLRAETGTVKRQSAWPDRAAIASMARRTESPLWYCAGSVRISSGERPDPSRQFAPTGDRDRPAAVSNDPDLDRRTIRDFGEQWTAFRDNGGYYGSIELFRDVFGPLLEQLALERARVVDLGAGTGRFVRILLEAGAAHVTAVEPSEAFSVLLANTVDLRDRVTCLNVPGDRLPPTGNMDLIFSFGVLHHIKDPAPVVGAALRALRAGGKCAVWLYGREGNGVYLAALGALTTVTRRLPHFALAGLSLLLDGPLVLYAALCRHFRFLPLAAYTQEVIARLTPDKRRLVIYDQLNPAYAKYYTRAEAQALLEQAGFIDVRLHHRHAYSWSVVGTRPATDSTVPLSRV
jgi:SAM-dependent methyltransferase